MVTVAMHTADQVLYYMDTKLSAFLAWNWFQEREYLKVAQHINTRTRELSETNPIVVGSIANSNRPPAI